MKPAIRSVAAHDIHDLTSAASAFKTRLEDIKRRTGGPDLEWYRYDSLRVFPLLDSSLKAEWRDLGSLRGPSPLVDIGCGDGDLSFFFDSIGWPVIAIDNKEQNHNQTRGFAALHQALGSKVEFHDCDINHELPLAGRTFGLSLFLGILYHLKDPFSVMERLARHTRHCILSTRVAQATAKGTSIEDEPVAYLLDRNEANNDPSNYWIFSRAGLHRLLERTGWDVCEYVTAGVQRRSTPSDNDRDQRAYCTLRSRLPDPWPGAGIDLDGGWHAMEGGSWRWTERVFAVRVQGPFSERPALRFKFVIPQAVFDATGPVELNAFVSGKPLGSYVCAKSGPHLYERPLPSADSVQVRFELSHCWGPSSADRRELGVQVVFWNYDGSAPTEASPITVT